MKFALVNPAWSFEGSTYFSRSTKLNKVVMSQS